MASSCPSFDPDAIVDFWLGEDISSPDANERSTRRWFFRDNPIHAELREPFGGATEAALAGEFDDKGANPRDWLGLLILLDQLQRNAFRDSRQ